jgi:hypothetical protein
MIATPATAELRTEIGALDLVKLLQFALGFIAHRARNVNLQSDDSHTPTSSPGGVCVLAGKAFVKKTSDELSKSSPGGANKCSPAPGSPSRPVLA